MPTIQQLPSLTNPATTDLIPVQHLSDGLTYQVSLANALQGSTFGGVYNGATAFGIVADGKTDNTSALNTAFTTINSAGGGTLVLPGSATGSNPALVLFSSQLNLSLLTNITITGAGPGNQTGTGSPTILRYTGTGATSAINLQSARAIQFLNVGIQWNNSGFTGYLLDLQQAAGHGNTTNILFQNCTISGSGPSVWTSAAGLVILDGAYSINFIQTRFQGGNYNIVGRLTSAGFNNVVYIQGCNFENAVTCAIRNPHQSWDIGGGTVFEPLNSDAAGAIIWDSGVPGEAISVTGCWLGDDSAGVTGTWFTLGGGGNGINISNNVIGCQTATTAIAVTGNNLNGLVVKGNDFNGSAGSSVGITFGSTVGHGPAEITNNGGKTSLGTWLTGNIPPGSRYDQAGGTPANDAPIVAGFNNIIFSSDAADFETGVGRWQSNTRAVTGTTSGGFARHGFQVLQVAANSGVTTEFSINQFGGPALPFGLVSGTASQSYTGMASFLLGSGQPARVLTLELDAYSVSGIALSPSRFALAGATFSGKDNAFSWTQLTCNGTTPSGTAFIGMIARWQDLSTVTQVFLSGNIATLTAVNDYTVGQSVNVAGLANTQFNGTFTVVSGFTTSFSYALVGANVNTTADTGQALGFLNSGEIHYFDTASVSLSSGQIWQPAGNNTMTLIGNTIQGNSGGDLRLVGGRSGALYLNEAPNGGPTGTIMGDGRGSQPLKVRNGHVCMPWGTPTITAGSGAGTGSVVSVSGSDHAGVFGVTVGTGASTSANIATITFGGPYLNTPRTVHFSPAEPNAAGLWAGAAIWEDAANRNSGSIAFKVGASGLASGVAYKWNYWVIE